MAEKLPKPIEIANFQKGISNGPFLDGGTFSKMIGVDVQTRPGSARLNYDFQTVTVSSGTMYTPKYIVYEPVNSLYYLQDSTGQIFYSTDATGGTWNLLSGNNPSTDCHGNGLVIYNNYLIAFRDYSIDIYGDISQGVNGRGTNSGTGSNNLWNGLNTSSGSAITSSGTTVTGYNTTFTTSFVAGDYIYANGQVQVVNTIASDTSLTTVSAFSPAISGSIPSHSAAPFGKLGWYGGGSAAWKQILSTYTPILGSIPVDHIPYLNPFNSIVYFAEYLGITTSTQFIGVPAGYSGLGAINQVSGKSFNPYDSTTYTFQSQGTGEALVLPLFYQPTKIKANASTIYVATSKDVIFPWNGTSAAPSTAILCPESNITTMETIGNFIYFAAGNRGNIYWYNGYYVQFLNQISPYLTNIPVQTLALANMIRHNGRIFFFVNAGLTSNNNASGIWSFNPNTNVLVQEYPAGIANSNPVILGTLYSAGVDSLMYGYYSQDSSTYALRITRLTGNKFISGGGLVETAFFNVGQPLAPRPLENINILLGGNLNAGESIQIDYRPDTVSSYSGNLITFDYATYGAIDAIKLPFGRSFVNVQFLIYINPGTSGATTPQLNNIIIT